MKMVNQGQGNTGEQLWAVISQNTPWTYVSRDVQDRIINPVSVAADLNSKNLDITSDKREEIIQYACSDGKQLYTILALLNKQGYIQQFEKHKITDADLPFEFSFKGLLLKNSDEHASCFSNWEMTEMGSFYEFQWYITRPKFELDSNQKPQKYDLSERVRIPWKIHGEVGEPGHSVVRKVSISKSDHGFAEVCSQSSCCSYVKHTLLTVDQVGGDYFAWKTLQPAVKTHFVAELANLLKLPTHDHLTPVLTAFTHGETYNFLFPWASGGNVEGLWKRYKDPKFSEWALWLAKQCSGLANGLSKIHDIRPILSDDVNCTMDEQKVNTAEGSLKKNDEKSFGRHGDIKPDNVLVFCSNKDDNMGTLKLTDFGLTVFRSARSVSQDYLNPRAKPLTYNAPEGDAGKIISRRYDVWCLGCLYLELATWILLGHHGLQVFRKLRMTERGDRKWFESDQFFKKQQRPNEINDYRVKRVVRKVTISITLLDCTTDNWI